MHLNKQPSGPGLTGAANKRRILMDLQAINAVQPLVSSNATLCCTYGFWADAILMNLIDGVCNIRYISHLVLSVQKVFS